jgi:outer membrane protein assembly factor BamB
MVVLLGALALAASGCDWTNLGYGPARTGTSPGETTLGPGNVAGLQQAWSAVIGAGPSDQSAASWSPVVGSKKVLVGTNDGRLRAFDQAGVAGCAGAPKVCQPVWTANLGGAPLTPSVAGGVVYVTAGNTMYALDAATGLTSWTAAPAVDSPVIDGGRVYVSAGTTIAAFDAAGVNGCSGAPKTCQPLWSSAPAACQGIATECRFSAPSVAGGKVYAVWAGNLGFGQAYLQAFDAAGAAGCGGTPKRCAPLWQSWARGNQPAPPPVISDGRVFVVANFVDTISETPRGAWLEAHDASSGALLWDSKLDGFFSYPPVVSGDRLFVAAGRIRAFDATGTQGCQPRGAARRCQGLFEIANLELPGTAAIANGVRYDGSAPFFIEGLNVPGAVRAYNLATLSPACQQFNACAPLWTSPDLGGTTSTPIVSDGAVFVAANGKLRSFRLP